MYDNENYPVGSDTPDAPWNAPVIQKMDFEVETTVMLSKIVTVTTDNYIPDGECADTSDTDWKDAYDESGHYTIQELLTVLKGYIQQDIERYKGSKSKELYLKALLDACDGWTVIEERYDEHE